MAVERYVFPVPPIGAMASVHGMTMVTRNMDDFELIGVEILNPGDFKDSD